MFYCFYCWLCACVCFPQGYFYYVHFYSRVTCCVFYFKVKKSISSKHLVLIRAWFFNSYWLDFKNKSVRTISPGENCPLDNCPTDNCPLDDFLSDYFAPGDCPRGKLPSRQSPPRQLPPNIIASEENCPPENNPLDDCPWIFASEQLPHR